jgi:predicted site-specific integrase-resolvase
MDTENARVTRTQAAEIARVSERTINRWAQRGLLRVHRPNGPWGPAEYETEQVLAVSERTTEDVPLPETDISG